MISTCYLISSKKLIVCLHSKNSPWRSFRINYECLEDGKSEPKTKSAKEKSKEKDKQWARGFDSENIDPTLARLLNVRMTLFRIEFYYIDFFSTQHAFCPWNKPLVRSFKTILSTTKCFFFNPIFDCESMIYVWFGIKNDRIRTCPLCNFSYWPIISTAHLKTKWKISITQSIADRVSVYSQVKEKKKEEIRKNK